MLEFLRIRIRSILAIAIGLLVAAFGLAVVFSVGDSTSRWVLAASDWWMLSDDGPRLGRQTNQQQTVLVTYGEQSAIALKKPPNLESDRELYESLVRSGVKVIADTRALVAASREDFEQIVQPTLEMIKELSNDETQIGRNCMFGSEVEASEIEPYGDFIVHDAVDVKAATRPILYSRIYPFVDFDFYRWRETMAPWAVRSFMSGDSLDTPKVLQVLDETGLAAVWLNQYPQLNEFLQLEQPNEELTAYPIGKLRVDWMAYASAYPTVCPAGCFIDYAVDPADFPHVEYSEVVQAAEPISSLRGKIAIIGLALDFVPSNSRFSIPTRDEHADQTEVLAAAICTMLDGRSKRLTPHWVFITCLFLFSVAVSFSIVTFRLPIAITVFAAAFVIYCVGAVVFYRHGWLTDLAVTPSVLVVSALSGGAYRYAMEIRSRARITDMFGRYVPKAVVTQLIQQSDLRELAIGGITRNVTVLFADVRGFTAYSETLTPEKVLEELNQLLQIMVDCTFKHEGTVDKFIGDAILVLFNAPLDQPNHVAKAVQTAWDIQSQLRGHSSGLSIGIGIHSGYAVVGNVGTPKRMEYTAIGSTVNIASRLCDLARAGEIVVSAGMQAELKDSFQFSDIERVRVKGLEAELSICRLKLETDPDA